MMNTEEAIKILEEYSGIDLSVVDKLLPGIGSESKKIDEAIKVAIEALKGNIKLSEAELFEKLCDIVVIEAQAEVIAQLDIWDIGAAFKDVMLEDSKRDLPGSGYKAAYTFFSRWFAGDEMFAEEEPKEES